MTRKKTFVLLEVLIGFALVSASILPFLRYPFQHMREEIRMLFEIQVARAAHQRLCAIERSIFEKEVDPDLLFPKKLSGKQGLVEQTVAIELPNAWKRNYTEKVYFESAAQREDEQFHYSLVHIHLSYAKKGHKAMEFHTELVVQRKRTVEGGCASGGYRS